MKPQQFVTSGSLNCDICGKPMEQDGQCFKCECGQQWRFTEQGAYCTILKALYPSRMTERDPIYQEYLDYRLASCEHHLKGDALCGIRTPEQAESCLEELVQAIAQKRQDIAASKTLFGRIKAWLTRTDSKVSPDSTKEGEGAK